MRDGEGERIRRVAWRRFVEREKRANHVRDLALVGVTLARDDTLHVRRRIFGDGNFRPGQTQEDDASRVTELRGRLRIPMEEQRFDRPDEGTVFGYHLSERSVEDGEPLGKRERGAGVDHAVRHMAEAIAVGSNDPPPEVSRARIDAEDDHAS
jgi:hypothetical protein